MVGGISWEVILLAKSSTEERVLDELLQSRCARLGQRFPHEPIPDPHEVNRRRGQHVLQVSFHLADVAGTTQPMGADPFGQRPLNARTLRILSGILRRGVARTRRLQRVLVLLGPHGQGAPLRPRTVHPVRTRVAIFPRKFHLYHLIAIRIHRWRPA